MGPSDDRTNCWLWSDKALPCPWGDGALGPAHPGATMIECDDTQPHCQASDIGEQMHKHITTTYKFNADDFTIFGPNYNCNGISGNLNCPADENKIARTVSFCCKVKRGKAVWKFKGDPAWKDTNPEKVKCKKID